MPWRDDLQGVTAVVAVSPSENQSQVKYITGELKSTHLYRIHVRRRKWTSVRISINADVIVILCRREFSRFESNIF